MSARTKAFSINCRYLFRYPDKQKDKAIESRFFSAFSAASQVRSVAGRG
jgi:hypothetical protein